MASVSGVGRGRGLREPGLLAWLRLMRVFQKVDRLSGERLRTWDLSVGQFDVLARVGAAEGIVQQELADSLLVTKGNVCQLLDRMEGRGLIVRRREGRNNRIFLTEEGRRLFDEVVPTHEALVAERFSALSRAEQERLHELLRKLDRALDRRTV
jgi:DNA-binding MarR family transcriptional regulator